MEKFYKFSPRLPVSLFKSDPSKGPMGEVDRREQILEAADRLLRHYGPHKTTIADVAREANVGVGTVYLEFCSKEALIEELSQTRHRAVLDAMRAAMSAPRKSF